ncbi:hypothetical protein NMS21_004186 [Vibrio alginolyticus]|nr:hypothetical protein [Vibrio alginolyticus]
MEIFSLSAVELRVFQVGQPKGVVKNVDLSQEGVSIGQVVIETYLSHFDAENQVRVVFDTVQRRGFVCQLDSSVDVVIGEFLFTDEVFWRAILEEVAKGRLTAFLNGLREGVSLG